MHSVLYIVATPLGNLGDFSHRAVEVLRQVTLIAAEDTRQSRRLLQHYAIDTRCIAYHEHSDKRDEGRIFEALESGGSVALISDAGTPLISDPGYRLVRRAQELGVAISPIPGPCSPIAALSASGLPTDRFFFEGFLPARRVARENRLRELAMLAVTLVIFEAPHRLVECMDSAVTVLGEQREAALARELTKTFETIRRGNLGELAQWVRGNVDQQRGEIVLLFGAAPQHDRDVLGEPAMRLARQLAEELPAARAAAVTAEHFGLKRKVVYDYLLRLSG